LSGLAERPSGSQHHLAVEPCLTASQQASNVERSVDSQMIESNLGRARSRMAVSRPTRCGPSIATTCGSRAPASSGTGLG